MGRVMYFFIALVFLISVLQTSYLLKTTNEILYDSTNLQASAVSAQGIVRLCVNTPPYLNLSSCLSNINQSTSIEDNTYVCQWDYTINPGEFVNFSYEPIIQNGLNFSLNESGYMYIWANQSGVGSFPVIITLTDNATCGYIFAETYPLYINDINDPPYLKKDIAGISLEAGSTIGSIYMNDYFGDFDGDVLSFNASSPSPFTIYFLADSQMIISAPSNFCEEITTYFNAIDPGNLSAYSNMVTIRSICNEEQPPAGGGGGGGDFCDPQWQCRKWGDCLPNGTRARVCVDIHGCDLDNLKRTFWENCTYIPTCFDGIQNQGEEGVDCGGPCPSCNAPPTCFDGIQNQREEGVDCGGPCDPCFVPPTCFDGLKNGDELGVDCGGSCQECKEIQIPGIIAKEDSSWVSLALTASLILASMFLFYIVFRKEIKSLLAKFGWWLTRKRRRQVLLSKNYKKELLDKIKLIEHDLSLKKNVVSFNNKEQLVQKFLELNRQYLVWALKLPLEYTLEELQISTDKLLFHDSLKNILISFAKKEEILEKKDVVISKLHFSYMIEELKTLVLGTSEYSKEDNYVASNQDIITGNSMAKIIKLLRNAMIALQYGEVDVAQKKYILLLGVYELLDEQQKMLVYSDIARLYHHIKYLLAFN